MLSGDVEINTGPDTLDFWTWNLISIPTHDFSRVSLIEAYNSVFNYDLIDIVETHLDSTIDKDELALEGNTFINENHLQNLKRVVLVYIYQRFPSIKNHPDVVTFPECILYEIQLNRKKYFFAVIYRSPSQGPEEFDNFTTNFELILSKKHA